jgi:hypothetical protein
MEWIRTLERAKKTAMVVDGVKKVWHLDTNDDPSLLFP